jgi:hypothetical protein
VTVRADLQQDVNLRVPGGVTTAYPGSTPYDVSFVQFLQGDLLRGYQYFNQGRRVLAVPMHDGVLPVVPGAPKGAARIALDGSVAAFVPAERALSWQLTAPDGKPVVRERYWVTFAAGEMRSCTNCHGVNKTDVVLGQGPPANSPKALRELAGWYKDVTGNGLVGDTIGIYKASVNWMAMRNDNSSGPADVSFNPTSYQAGWIPFSGDWNGDGIDTVGFYDPATATFRLHDVNGPGPATLTFVFGTPGTASIPIAGDWDNDGVDTVGLFEVAAGYFRLRNFNASGMADVKFPFGPPGGVPVAGDWDADGRDSIGVYDPGTGQWFLRNANAPGPADVVVPFPAPGVKSWPLAGDWNNDGITSLGFYEDPSGTFYLRSTNGVSASVKQFTFGPTPEAFPLAGNWNGG